MILRRTHTRTETSVSWNTTYIVTHTTCCSDHHLRKRETSCSKVGNRLSLSVWFLAIRSPHLPTCDVVSNRNFFLRTLRYTYTLDPVFTYSDAAPIHTASLYMNIVITSTCLRPSPTLCTRPVQPLVIDLVRIMCSLMLLNPEHTPQLQLQHCLLWPVPALLQHRDPALIFNITS